MTYERNTKQPPSNETENTISPQPIILQDNEHKHHAVDNDMHRDDSDFRYFTAAGYEHIKNLIIQIRTGNKDARNELIEMIWPRLYKTIGRLQKKIFTKKVDSEQLMDAATDSLMSGLESIETGSIASWNSLNQHLQSDIGRRFEIIEKKKSRIRLLPWEKWIKLPARQTDTLVAQELKEAISQAISTIDNPRYIEVIQMRQDEITLAEIADHFGVTASRVEQMANSAYSKIKNGHLNYPAIVEWKRDNEGALSIVHAQEENERHAAQRRKNHQIMIELEEDFIAQKKIICGVLRDIYLSYSTTIYEKIDVEPHYVDILRDIKNTNIHDLIEALDDSVINQFKSELSRLVKNPAVEIFAQAVEKLRELVDRFKELGGNYVPADIPIPAPIAGLDFLRTHQMMEEERRAAQDKEKQERDQAIIGCFTLQNKLFNNLCHFQKRKAEEILNQASVFDVSREELRLLLFGDIATPKTANEVARISVDSELISKLANKAKNHSYFIKTAKELAAKIENFNKRFTCNADMIGR